MKTLLNQYIKRPLFWDIIISLLIISAFNRTIRLGKFYVAFNEDSFRSVLSDLVSSSISLAGFVLASLTIIVTFKDNITHKEQASKLHEKEEFVPIELLFSSKHYKRIVGVFSWSTLIFILIFFSCSLLKMLSGIMPATQYLNISLFAISLTTLTVLRSLLILYNIIKLQVIGRPA